MKKIVTILVAVALCAIAMGTLAGCDSLTKSSHTHEYGDWTVVTKATCTTDGLEKRVCSCGEEETREIKATGHTYADEFTCHDRKCTVCEAVLKATTEHTLNDEYTCHDRTCSVCKEVVKATTEHTYADEYTCHDRTCGCGYVSAATTEHTYADEFTCHDRTCDCGYVCVATTEHTPNDEFTCHDRTCTVCGDAINATTEHTYNANGICEDCGINIKSLFLEGVVEAGVTPTISCDTEKGSYNVSTTTSNIYFKIPGSIITKLNDLGYTTLTINVINTATDPNVGFRVLYVAAEDTNNLWYADKAITMITDRSAFWNNNKTATITLDLEDYEDKDVFFFSDCGTVPFKVVVDEFFNYENKANWINDDGSTTVTYSAENGYVITAPNANAAFYAIIPGNVLKYYINNGYTKMTIAYANSLDGHSENFAYTGSRILPKLASNNEEDWYYANGAIVQYCTLNNSTGFYEDVIYLDNIKYNYAQDLRICFGNYDYSTSPETAINWARIASITFEKDEAPALSTYLVSDTNSTVNYVEGTGYTISATDANNLYYAKISGSVMSYFINHGYTNMVITYNNNWEEGNCPNVGNFVNTKSRIIPKPLAGGEDWSTYDNYISQYATQVGNDFVQTINLVDGVNNFTVDTQIVFINSDVNSNAVTRAYIKSITFTK